MGGSSGHDQTRRPLVVALVLVFAGRAKRAGVFAIHPVLAPPGKTNTWFGSRTTVANHNRAAMWLR